MYEFFIRNPRKMFPNIYKLAMSATVGVIVGSIINILNKSVLVTVISMLVSYALLALLYTFMCLAARKLDREIRLKKEKK